MSSSLELLSRATRADLAIWLNLGFSLCFCLMAVQCAATVLNVSETGGGQTRGEEKDFLWDSWMESFPPRAPLLPPILYGLELGSVLSLSISSCQRGTKHKSLDQ